MFGQRVRCKCKNVRCKQPKAGVTKRAIEKNIKNLRDRGILIHEGSDKAGYWRIIVKPPTEQ